MLRTWQIEDIFEIIFHNIGGTEFYAV